MARPLLQRADDARAALDQPRVAHAAEQIASSVRRVYLGRTSASGALLPIRDVHPKAHGLLEATFRVADEATFARIQEETGADLRQGVFSVPGAAFAARLRFSSSNKRPQSDEVADGRGLAIKLEGVPGERLRLPGEVPTAVADAPPKEEQDFILLNDAAFFARDAADMVEAAELQARDAFPGAFFVGRTAGLMALVRMGQNQASSLLDLSYFSQTPYALGDAIVKYRVRRVPSERTYAGKHTGANKLRDALRSDLSPAKPGATAKPESVVLEFGVQLAHAAEGFPVDDATLVWREDLSPFLRIGSIEISRSKDDGKTGIGGADNIEAADKLTFSPFNGIIQHEPLGSINFARGVAYRVSQDLRGKLQVQRTVVISRPRANARMLGGAWERLMTRLRRGLNEWLRRAGTWPIQILLKPWAGVLPLALLGFLTWRAWANPMGAPFQLNLIGWMPSEAAIPAAIYSAKYPTAKEQALLERDPRYLFRYAPTGSEYDGGVPYWIFRVLPRIAPERFGPAKGYESFGLGPADDQDYYLDYHRLPRGMVLSDQVVNVLGNDLEVSIKVVSFNCASCHRGEYRDEVGQRVFVDGMPNNVIDTAGYKMAVFGTMRDARFTADRVILEIDRILAEEARREPRDAMGKVRPTELDCRERAAYRLLVREVKRRASLKSIDWIEERPDNGPGRVDAFGALRFEFLGYDTKDDKHISTVDLPSIWNQSAAFRPRQHWDGNTADVRGRNFGAIIGVGGLPFSVRQRHVGRVAHWIAELPSPAFPFDRPDEGVIERGQKVYGEQCQHCHGTYRTGAGQPTRLAAATACMLAGISVGTDGERLAAADADFIQKLNLFGERAGIWGAQAFDVPSGYLCPPLDGIWARAPYLHNGSVPTLYHLLLPPSERPPEFFRGNTSYDRGFGGFSTEAPSGEDALRAFHFVTQADGNNASGHAFGPLLDATAADPQAAADALEADRRALVAYLLTL